MDGEPVAFEQAEELLLIGTFEDCRPLWYSSNYVYLAQLCAGGETFAAVYKPRKGEAPLWDFPDGTLYRREVAAYRLARLLGWPIVPPTVVRGDGPHGPGSLQVYVPHNPESHFFVQRDNPELVSQLQRMCVFDVVANNADRKGGHCLLDASGHIWGIDHGLCFHEQYKLRSVIWDWAGDAVPDEWLDDVERATAAIDAESDEAAPLLELISRAERTALLTRARKLLRDRRYPVPGAQRHYPWPLV
jgi:uncharacterized repeat protein (TIGR03843 family)